MEAVPPVSGNQCRGTNSDGTPNTQLYCLRGNDAMGNPVYTCAKWRRFSVSCPKLNSLCSNRSEAWVAAITVCNQRLF